MKILQTMGKKIIFFKGSALAFFFLLSVVLSAAPDVNAGKDLFKANCASCHNKNMKDDLTGPALGGVEQRWSGKEKLLYSWIKNSQGVIASGDAYAVALYNKYNKSQMSSFPNLKDEDIASILAYIDAAYTGKLAGAPAAAATGAAAGPQEKSDSNILFWLIGGILVLIAFIMLRVVQSLNALAQAKEGLPVDAPKSLRQMVTSKGMVGFAIFALIVLGGYTTVNNAINMGRMQGYQPDQPIKFSHTTHAGLHKIDCQYCHDGARRSKQSVIPAANTCMNCHKAIKVGSKYGTGELTKIFASIGFNPNDDKYIDNYSNLSEAEIEKIYKEWIGASYVKANSLTSIDDKGKREVERQWSELKSSMTSETKPKIQGPIEWVRIHNLPDHVYFNHAQHVSVGKVACQTCHGKIEQMDVVKQYSSLSMGWCINCHRETEVKFKDNAFYDSYKRYHDELKSGKREKVTVEDIGGLECQKCHY
jgi:mono/diheme cytochrome c family protein